MSAAVALRKESVDRNFFVVSLNYKEVLSLSARRAWIEIPHTLHDFPAPKSLSARRAWIEMILLFPLPPDTTSRSPQGERG